MGQTAKSQELARPINPEIISSLVIHGDLGRLTPVQKVQYYNQFCDMLGLNPLTQPFQLIRFQGKEVLYATKTATEQLRKLYNVSVVSVDTRTENDIHVVTVKVQDSEGRTDVASGAVPIQGLAGTELANAIMKTETKAKRRATLSICGLGMLDESEIDSVGSYQTEPLQPTLLKSESEAEIRWQQRLQAIRDLLKSDFVDENTRQRTLLWLSKPGITEKQLDQVIDRLQILIDSKGEPVID